MEESDMKPALIILSAAALLLIADPSFVYG